MKYIFIVLSLISQVSYSATAINYADFIKSGALKPYPKQSPQLRIIAKFNAKPEAVNLSRKKAAELAIDSEKCDLVISSDVVGDGYLEYEVICQNGAIIYLTQSDMRDEKAAKETVVSEKEKALPRSIARSRCEQLVIADIENKKIDKSQLQIDRYKISTLITELGETIVRIGYTIKSEPAIGKEYIAECNFSHNHKDKFEIKIVN